MSTERVLELANEADVFVDEQGIRYWIEGCFEEDGYFRCVNDGQEYEIAFGEVNLEKEYFMKLTRM